MNMRANSNRISSKNRAYENIQKNSPMFGIYIGQVTATKDLSRTGRIQVFIATLAKDKGSNDGLFDAMWSSPFAGGTDSAGIGEDIENYKQTQQSYGMWMVPPDIGNLVLVCFGDGNTKFPFVVSCLYPDRYNHMVPGMPAGKSYSDPNMKLPVAEKNKRDAKTTHNDATRPLHVDISEGIVRQGLANDPLRGAGTAGSRRESPSEVFGILTPGPRDTSDFNHRLGGHQFIMDDNLNSRNIRIRTAGGNQILMDDTTGVIYMINKTGSAWVELTRIGDINFFGEGSINFRAKGSFNLRADQDINIEAGQDVNIKASGDNIAGEYKGSNPLGAIGLPPLGTGGNLRLEGAGDLTAYGGLNTQITANGGDIDMNAGGRLAATAGGPLGIDLLAAMGGIKMQSTLPTSILSAAGYSVTSAGPASIMSPSILLNSGGAPALPALPAIPAPQMGLTGRKDSPAEAPEFDREGATTGASPAAPTAGKRQGKQDKIKTIVGNLLTSEPYIGHSQYDPIAASEAQEQAESSKALDNMPANATSETASAPADAQTPDGSEVGTGYKDKTTGDQISSVQNAVTDATAGLGDVIDSAMPDVGGYLDAIPTYADVQGALNNFKDAAQTKLLEIAGLGALINGIKAAIPPIRFPTSNALAQKIIGIGKQLTEMEARLKNFGLSDLGLPADLLEGQLGQMKGMIDTAMSTASSVANFEAQLKQAGIDIIPDGTGRIFQDAMGNKIVDFSQGIGPIGETLGLVADQSKTWNSVSNSISVPVSDNQQLALTEFARSIGTDNFKNSNVLEALNKGEYHRVPHFMSGWVLSKQPGKTEMTENQNLVQMRAFQASVFQSPDGVAGEVIDVAKGTEGGSINFLQLAEAIDGKRNDYYESILNPAMPKQTIADMINNLGS